MTTQTEALNVALDALRNSQDYKMGRAITVEAVELIEEALAQPAVALEQEPVAWMTPDGEGFRIRFSPPVNDVPLGWDALYTTPPQRTWVGLTDEEIEQCQQGSIYYFYRGIEAKLKEKNNA